MGGAVVSVVAVGVDSTSSSSFYIIIVFIVRGGDRCWGREEVREGRGVRGSGRGGARCGVLGKRGGEGREGCKGMWSRRS